MDIHQRMSTKFPLVQAPALVGCGAIFLLVFDGQLQAKPLPLPDGRYVVDQELCPLSDDALVARLGDRTGEMVRILVGPQLSNGYEMSCRIGSVSISGDQIRFEAVCEREGEPEKVRGSYRMLSPTSFAVGNRRYSLCQEPAGRSSPVAASAEAVNWSEKIPNAWRYAIMKAFNREYVRLFDRNIDLEKPPFSAASVPLKQGAETTDAIIVKWHSSGFCGSGGCRLAVLLNEVQGFRIVLDVTGTDIEIGETSHRGLRDLWIDENRFRWSGQAYVRE